jgi:predicted ATPase
VITEIEIEGFKSLKRVHLRLGHFNLFIGTNASGKSNFLDALRVLQGIGYGFTIEEILNGKPKSASSEVWEPIRGGSAKADFIDDGVIEANGQLRIIRFSVHLKPWVPDGPSIRYSIAISAQRSCVRNEKLSVDGDEIFDSNPIENRPDSPVIEVRYYGGQIGKPPHLKFEKSRPVLHQLLHHNKCKDEHGDFIAMLIRALSNTQKLDPSPAFLRDYSQAHSAMRMGERGENFAALVKSMLSDDKTRSAYVSWLQQLTPTEVDDVRVLDGALGEPLFALKEHGNVYPAPILSDGTLRFAAIAAAFFQPDMPDILTIEEIENGIHPSRLRLLVELLKSQAKRNLQIMATTHSPIVLAWLQESDYATTFFCKRDEQTGASIISPLNEIPRFLDIVRQQPIADLFAEGWLEGAL